MTQALLPMMQLPTPPPKTGAGASTAVQFRIQYCRGIQTGADVIKGTQCPSLKSQTADIKNVGQVCLLMGTAYKI